MTCTFKSELCDPVPQTKNVIFRLNTCEDYITYAYIWCQSTNVFLYKTLRIPYMFTGWHANVLFPCVPSWCPSSKLLLLDLGKKQLWCVMLVTFSEWLIVSRGTKSPVCHHLWRILQTRPRSPPQYFALPELPCSNHLNLTHTQFT